MVHREILRRLACIGFFLGLGLLAGGARANVFTMPAGQASLDFVTVGDASNQADTRYASPGYGSVGYRYQMGKYDVTAAQYAQFLNAVATTSDPYGLYNPNMATAPIPYVSPWNPGNPDSVGCGIVRSGDLGSYTYSVAAGKENMPVNWVSWSDGLRFANWLSNGQPTGAVGPGTTETGSYTMTFTPGVGWTSQRNPAATYVLPSEDEWYKAAYYKGGSTNAGYWTYPTRSDTMPSNSKSATGTNNANFLVVAGHPPQTQVIYTDPQNFLTPVGYFAGSPGPYGTFDMGGDVGQLLETAVWGSQVGVWGGGFITADSYLRSDYCNLSQSTSPTTEIQWIGFRVSLVPEPGTLAIFCLSLVMLNSRRSGARRPG